MPPSDAEVQTAVFSALADPSRRAILKRLGRGEELTVGELAEPLAMSLPAVSKHLKILEHAGLLKRRREGRSAFMTLNPGPLKKANEWLHYYEQFWNESFSGLDLYLKQAEAPSTNDDQD